MTEKEKLKQTIKTLRDMERDLTTHGIFTEKESDALDHVFEVLLDKLGEVDRAEKLLKSPSLYDAVFGRVR